MESLRAVESKHVFLQVNTDALIRDLKDGSPTDAQVREHTLIYEQGSMAMGQAVTSFNVDVTCHDAGQEEEVYFTILPLHLYSYHKIYFTGFENLGGHDGISISPNKMENHHQITFKITVIKASEGAQVSLNLFATIEYFIAGNLIQVPICIDPVLRADQRR